METGQTHQWRVPDYAENIVVNLQCAPDPNLARMRSIVRYAWFVLVFNVLVILMGALVRATGSGAGCGRSWPSCDGELVPDFSGATAIEFSHRAVSGIALVLVGVLAVWVWKTVDQGEPARLGAGLSVISIIGEALIGAMIVLAEWVAHDDSIARAISVPLHLVNTLFLLATLSLTIIWLNGGRRIDWRHDRRMSRAVIIGGIAIVLLAASGAVTALADTLFPKDGSGSNISNFLTDLRVVHPILAVVAASLGWWFGGRVEVGRSLAVRLLPWLVGVMLVSGAMNVFLGVPIWMQLLHLLLADLLWVSYVFASAQALQASEVRAPV